jgi:hypothetical protein
MGRIRTIKPEFFKHSGLFDGERETGLPLRLGFAGLWTCCDREGRFKWRPRELKLDALPYDECDFSLVLDALASLTYRWGIAKFFGEGWWEKPETWPRKTADSFSHKDARREKKWDDFEAKESEDAAE